MYFDVERTLLGTAASKLFDPPWQAKSIIQFFGYCLTISVLVWLNNEVDVIDLAEFPSKFRDGLVQALQDQDAIGWEAALKGFLSVEWRHLLTLGLGDHERVQEVMGVQKLRFVLKTFGALANSLWMGRNQALHGISEGYTKNKRQEEIAEIREFYQLPKLIPAADQHSCEQPLSTILSRAPASRRRWLHYMRLARARLTKDGQRQTLIMAFFRAKSG